MVPFRFYLITDRLHSRHAPHDLLRALLRAGLRALQVREKDLPPAALFAYCRKLQDGTAGCPPAHFFLNDRADLALSLGFAGVHLREDSLPLADQHASLKEHLTFAVSTHHLEGVRAAAEAGAAFATFGQVFETPSKSAYGHPVGLVALA